ncbi:UNVERIFIED_CONTAM: SEC15 family protein, partial [Bacteroidetes bacterium 56_B9]
SPQAATAFKLDVDDLVDFVEALPEAPVLLESLTSIRQTTDLMMLAAEGKGEEFFDSSKSQTRFEKVDKIKGAELLEKVYTDTTGAPREKRMSLMPDF